MMLIMTGMICLVCTAAFLLLYHVVLDQTKNQLQELARSQGRLIEAIGKSDAIRSLQPGDASRARTLSQVRESHNAYAGFGQTGEIVLGERTGNQIHFLLHERNNNMKIPDSVPWIEDKAVPMYRALSGQSGVITGKDYNGTVVIAAYEYLEFMQLGIVAKMAISEIRYPFFHAALITALMGIASLLLAFYLQSRLVNPMVQEMFLLNDQLGQREVKLANLSNQLSKYLSPQVYTSLFEGKSNSGIFTRRKKLTVFFSDIVGFTAQTESLEPEDMSHLLNSYLNAMAELVIRFGGTLDKFIGDAVLVFFGDPETLGLKEDAAACLDMAIAMRETIETLKLQWKDYGFGQDFAVRMGVTSGFCTVGNFGSESRMDYTIIGNQVNLAARFEANAAPGQLLISQETYHLVQDLFDCEPMPAINAKGFSRPMPAWQVIGRRNQTRTSVFEISGAGFEVSIDPQRVAASDRQKLREVLEKAQKSI